MPQDSSVFGPKRGLGPYRKVTVSMNFAHSYRTIEPEISHDEQAKLNEFVSSLLRDGVSNVAFPMGDGAYNVEADGFVLTLVELGDGRASVHDIRRIDAQISQLP